MMMMQRKPETMKGKRKKKKEEKQKQKTVAGKSEMRLVDTAAAVPIIIDKKNNHSLETKSAHKHQSTNKP